MFRSTKAVSCGYELGWEFVEAVLASKQTFSGYRKIVQARYERLTSPCPFMSLNTFIKWWFSWAAAMNIDFIQPCFSCGNDVKVLAADGTKIGITLKQANVVPIETQEDHMIALPTNNRRFNRTLINNSNTKKEDRKKINDKLNELCKYIQGKTVEQDRT